MRELGAWIADQPAGDLILKDNGNLQFRYRPEYRGAPLSHALPIQTDAHPHRVVRAVFAGLLPEGEVREALAHNLGISAENDFGLLERVGGDVAGAISLLAPGTSPSAKPEVRPLDSDELARRLGELPQRPLAADGEGEVRLSLAGAQAKLPVIITGDGAAALPLNSAAPTTHILKPEPARFPGLVDNEAFCMSLAAACDIPAASVPKAVTSAGTPYLIVERYDRRRSGDRVRRVHQEDLCQALGIPSEQKYQQEGGPAVAQCVALIRDTTREPTRELPGFLRALAFNWLIGNCDAHAKNYSLLYEGRHPSLAPL